MSRMIFIGSIVSLIALSGIIGYWSASSSFFAGRSIGSNGVMEIPMQAFCDSKSIVTTPPRYRRRAKICLAPAYVKMTG